MEQWVSIASKRHKIFEKNQKIRKHHVLNLDKYILDSQSENKLNQEIIDNLNKLNDLYKSGVLTKINQYYGY